MAGFGRTRRTDRAYLAGNLGAARILIFANNHAKGENDPTHILYLAPQQRREEGNGASKSGSSRSAATGTRNRYESCSNADGSVNDDSAPF